VRPTGGLRQSRARSATGQSLKCFDSPIALAELRTDGNREPTVTDPTTRPRTYYDELGLHPSATEREIRRAYRELSKRYHPDTTTLPLAIATPKFQTLNEAYATLSNYERRLVYDATIRYSRVIVAQAAADLRRQHRSPDRADSSPGFIDPVDRPLSSGEVFALFLMGATIVGCLVLAIGIAVLRGDPW